MKATKDIQGIGWVLLSLCALLFCFACGAAESPVETEDTSIDRKLRERAEAYEAWQNGEEGALEWLELAANGEEGSVVVVQPNELGALGQSYASKFTADYQMGVDSSHNRMQCGRTNPFQSCSVMTTKTVTFFIDPAGFGPPGTGFNDEIFKYVDQLRAQISPEWTVNEVFSSTPTPTFRFVNASCSGSSTSNNISSFSCVTLDGTGANLAEGTGVVGSYTTHSGAQLRIDMDDINARGITTIEELRLLRHAAGHCTLAGFGSGGRTDTGANSFASRMLVDVNFSPATISSGEKCRLKSYISTNNSAFVKLTPDCSGAN